MRKEILAEYRGQVWPINLAPDPDGRFALHQALQEESAARSEYMRLLRIFNDLMREGTLPEEESGLFLVSPEMDRKLYRLSAMDDDEDQETPFQEIDAQQLAEKNSLAEAVRSSGQQARLYD